MVNSIIQDIPGDNINYKLIYNIMLYTKGADLSQSMTCTVLKFLAGQEINDESKTIYSRMKRVYETAKKKRGQAKEDF